MELINYIRLIKFRYHVSFILVILGALIFTTQPFYELLKPLLVLYTSFNVLLYGGLYTLNDIKDIESDKRHPTKKNRPLPSGKVTVIQAYLLALACIFFGLDIVYFWFGQSVFLLCVLFIAVNLFYTRVAKKIPYVEIFFNALTHPMRFLLGALLVTNQIPYLLLLAIFLLIFGIASGRRIIEKRMPGWEARKVLTHYTEKKLTTLQILCFGLIIILAVIEYPFYAFAYLAIIVLYIIFVLGIYFSKHIINGYKWAFLN